MRSCGALAAGLSTYFRRTEGRGTHCVVEPVRRGTLDYFFAYPEDYAQHRVEWVDGQFGQRPHHPAFEVIYVYSQSDGTLDVNIRGARPAAGPLGYTRKSPLPPTSLDWLLRTDDQVDSLEDWYRDVTDRKKDVATCEHGDTLRRFHAACPRVMTVSAPPSPTETVWTDRGHDETSLHARPAPVLDLHAWHLTSFSQLAHGRHDERERRDVVVEPEDAGAIGAVADAKDAAVPLATFARGTHAGNCLHELLEQWDFHEDTAVLVDRGLRRHRLYSAQAVDAVRHTLAALKTTRLDGLDARLDTAASNKTLSEWEFLLPLGRAGITGQALSDLFARHARTADERHYAQDLAGLPSQEMS